MVLSVSEQTFTQEVLESSIPVLVNFGAPWCGLCRIIQPILMQFQANCGEQVKLVNVNADENFKLSNQYRLTTLPTLILIEEAKVRQRLDRDLRPDDLRQALEGIRVRYADRRKPYASAYSSLSPVVDWECRSA